MSSLVASIPATPSRRTRRHSLKPHGRRALIAVALAAAIIVLIALIPPSVHANSFNSQQASSLVGVGSYYLALGDSLAFGYQPNLDWSHSYTSQWYTNLKSHGATSFTNYGCNGETSATFINGGCPYWYALHNYYFGSQLNAAVSFIKAHVGHVSPISLDIGANDLLPDIDASTCTVSASWNTDLANVDARLTQTILPKLISALTVNGVRKGDLVMMNYYDPYQNKCPNSVSYVQTMNQHLAADAAQFGVPVADVNTAFGGYTVPDPYTCTYTWMCSSSADIHATTTGYGVIAGAFEAITGY